MRNAGATGDLVVPSVDGVDDVQPVLDVRDRRVIRQLVDELLEDLLRRRMRHVSSMTQPVKRDDAF